MVTPDQALNFYLALLSVQMAILGLVVAGIVTLMQLLHNTKPRRNMRLLVRRRVLYAYIGLLAGLLLMLCTGAWGVAFNISGLIGFFLNRVVGASLLALCLAGLFWFVWLVYKTRRLLEADAYLKAYIRDVTPFKLREYVVCSFAEDTDLERYLTSRRRKTMPANLYDPFQPIREYLKDNAFNLYDYGTATGLRLFSELFDKTFAAMAKHPAEYVFLARYMAVSCEEFMVVFRKTASEKRQTDVIKLLASKGEQFVAVPDTGAAYLSLGVILQALEHMAQGANDEDEIILCITRIKQLTDAYLRHNHKTSKADAPTSIVFDDACYAVARIAETYYLQQDHNLRNMPFISSYTGEHNTMADDIATFYLNMGHTLQEHPEIHPGPYLEAVESVIEILFIRYGEIVASGHHTRGLNALYQKLTASLYDVYRQIGLQAIKDKKSESFGLALSNIRRVIKAAKLNKLSDERAELTEIMLELSLRGLDKFGDVAVKADGRTITAYTRQTLDKHATQAIIGEAVKSLSSDVNTTSKAAKAFLASLR